MTTTAFQQLHQPYYELLLAAIECERSVDAAERLQLRVFTVELVTMIAAELSPYFFRPNREPAQLLVGGRIYELLLRRRVVANDALEALVDQLVDCARANILMVPR